MKVSITSGKLLPNDQQAFCVGSSLLLGMLALGDGNGVGWGEGGEVGSLDEGLGTQKSGKKGGRRIGWR